MPCHGGGGSHRRADQVGTARTSLTAFKITVAGGCTALTRVQAQALFTTSFPLLQGVMDITLKQSGRLPNNLAIATFGDNELLDFLECPVLSVAQRHCEVAERVLELVLELVLASLDEPKKPKPGLTSIRRSLYRRGSLSRR